MVESSGLNTGGVFLNDDKESRKVMDSSSCRDSLCIADNVASRRGTFIRRALCFFFGGGWEGEDGRRKKWSVG